MTDASGAAADSGDAGRVQADAPASQPRPRWVKVSLVAAAAVVVLFVVLQLVGGDHGPGRHLGGDSPSVSDDGGHQSPVDHSP